ncbi:helix-turn-helix domain-containing protein [Neobacillus niacini]|uniref:helix-turn-helix domain-containing protein n=1 Tax=Neobacillus niacini TaxID=86668 RepID=UPI0039835924
MSKDKEQPKDKKQLLPPILDVADVKEYLGIGLRQTYELVNSGAFKIVRINRRIKIPRNSFFEWVHGEIQSPDGEELD